MSLPTNILKTAYEKMLDSGTVLKPEELDRLQAAAQIEAMHTNMVANTVYTGNGGMNLTTGATITPSHIWHKERSKNPTMPLSITVVSNGFLVSNTTKGDHFVCVTMDDVKDRVVAMLAAHQMDLQE